MTRPQQYLTRMGLFLLIVIATAVALHGPLQRAFLANPILNTLIALVLLFGIGFIFRQVLRLHTDVDWLEDFRRRDGGLTVPPAPRLLAPMAAMLGANNGRIALSTLSTRSLLDSISARLDEDRELARYLIGLMIFLGLLGTFWGLLETVSSVGDTIRALTPESNDFAQMFGQLKRGLESPLSGMGTAFSSSLLGLSGSLVLGFLDLQAGQAQNRFYNELEEWLAAQTRLKAGALSDSDAGVPIYVKVLLEQTAESLDELRRTIQTQESSRSDANHALLQLSDRLSNLTDQMRAEQNLLIKLAEHQMELRPILQRLSDISPTSPSDDIYRGHLRNLDTQVTHLAQELREGRARLTEDIRTEIRLLTRTIAAVAEEERRN